MSMQKSLLALAATFALLAGPTLVQGAVTPLFTENLDAFDAAQDLGDGTTYAVQIIPEGSSPFSDGNAVRMFDLSTVDKPELQGELAAPLLEPFRVDFMSFDQSASPSGSAIRFRMGNSGASISSENRVAFSMSWQADGELTAKFNNPSDGTGDVDTKSSLALVGVQGITMIANGALAGNYDYSLFGETRSLNPLSYDVYINGVLLNSGTDAWYANGMEFHYLKTGSEYVPANGLQRFGLIGSSNANIDPDYLYDNVILSTGLDIIPEPSSAALLLIGFLALGRSIKGRKA